MRNRIGALIAVAVIAIGWWLLLRPAGTQPASRPAASEDSETPASVEAPPPASVSPTLRASTTPAAEAKAKPDAAKVALPPPSENAKHFRGKVVDEKKKPVAGAAIRVQDDGRVWALTSSGDDGTFEFAIDVPAGDGAAYAVLWASDGTRTAYRPLALRADPRWLGSGAETSGPHDLGNVELRPAIGFDVIVTGDGHADDSSHLLVTTGKSSLPMTLVNMRLDAEGRAHVDGLPAGSYRALAMATGRGRATADVILPLDPPGPVRLELPAERVLEVTVVEAGTEVPVPNATVRVSEDVSMGNSMTSLPYAPPPGGGPTGADGKVRLRGFAPDDRLTVSATAPGFSKGSGSVFDRAGKLVPAGATEITLPISRTRIVTWAVKAGESPVPPDGAVLVLRVEPGTSTISVPPRGLMVGGKIVVEGVNASHFYALAVTADGSIARLFCRQESDEGMETSFRPVRKIEVTVSYADGQPAVGFFVSARNQGNNPMGPAAKTDAAGKALLDGLYGYLVEVYVAATDVPYGGLMAGSVDLEKGSGKLEATVERERKGIAHVRVAGKPSLPAGYGLGAGFVPFTNQEADEAAGTIAFTFRPMKADAKLVATFQAPGYLSATAEVPPSPDGTPVTLDFDLQPAGRLSIHVVSERGNYRLQIQKWDDVAREWTGTNFDSQVFGPWSMKFDDKGVAHLDALPPGRYRAIDAYSGTASAAADVVPGGAAAELRLDASGSVIVKGRVALPEGFPTISARVVREGAARILSRWGADGESTGVAEDGTFQLRVPGNSPVTLRPTHPLLVPAAVGGTAVVTGAQEGIVLTMVKGNTAILHFDRALTRDAWMPGQGSGLKVLLYRGEPKGAPALSLSPVIDGAKATFGGFAPGEWTVWIDAIPFAPVVLRGVKLLEGETDLGAVALSEGSSIKLTVKVKEGAAVPRINFWVWKNDEEPKYSRNADMTGAEGRVFGLGAGTFRVSASPMMAMGQAGTKSLDQTVELDGTNEVSLTLDLR